MNFSSSLVAGLVGAALLVSAPAIAQNTQVVPSSQTSNDALGQLGLPGLGLDSRLQVVIDSTLLVGMVGQSINGVAFRVDADNFTGLEPASGTLTARLGTALSSAQEPSSSFQANISSAVQVFQGSWSADPAAVAQDPWGVHLTFQTPYTYLGGDLVLDLEGQIGSASSFWAFDAVSEFAGKGGSVGSVGQACGLVGPNPAHCGERDLRPGGSPRILCLGEPGATATLLVGSSLFSSPVDLGLVGFPGCALHVQSFASLSVPVNSFLADPSLPGVAQVEPLFPNANSLYGAELAAQWVNFGTRLEVSNALTMRLAQLPVTVPLSTVHGATQSSTGSVSPGFGPVLRFEW